MWHYRNHTLNSTGETSALSTLLPSGTDCFRHFMFIMQRLDGLNKRLNSVAPANDQKKQ